MGAGKVISLSSADYVHLHNHTHHSLLDGLTKIPELVDRVKTSGMEAVAITDHGSMSGAIELYKTAKSAGIKPIIGMEAYVAARSRHDRDPSKDRQRFHLTILAMNNTGYKNLMQLTTLANLEGLYYRPRIDHELLEKYNEGLIILSGCASSEVSENLRSGDYEKAKSIAAWYQSIFGDRYYLELQDHGHPDYPTPWDVQVDINKNLDKISKELGIEQVVTSDAHYLDIEDKEAHEILLCVGTGSFLSDEKRMSLADFDLHVATAEEIISRWGHTNPQAVKNTKAIADRCDVELDLDRILIPKFPTPNGESEKEYLDHLVYRGMAMRYLGMSDEEAAKKTDEEVRKLLTDEQRDRLDMELGVLDRMGYNGYFLIVQDFINWGKSQGIIFGPGRGSAAGSIVSYALNVTDLDPLKYDLLFERFLNPDRISMPDIDIDIQDTRRNEVIEYCASKYGRERVTNIGTFGTMAARAAVRDVARVLEVPYAESDRLAKLVPPPVQGRHTPLKVSIKTDPDLKREYDSSPVAKRVLDFAARLDGTNRSHGVHAAGVVIAPENVVEYVPLEMAQKGVVATQYPMGPVEELGLLKMDFLGLSNLTIINNTLRTVKKVYGVDIDLSTLALDDEATYELFQRGDTTGVFQLESDGMKRYLRQLKPSKFDDIIAMVALYRPGPMQFIDSFIKRKHGEEKITFLDPHMENALRSTYGVLVYQEQFMQISKDWCGFTGGQADTLRKAVGKKQIDLMKKIKPEFVEGAIKHGGAKKEVAEMFWDQLEEFANYAFNKSHAACYGLIAYWTAYLKANYPAAFMAALMTSDQNDIDRLAVEINECHHMGIEVLSPDVNESFKEFAVVPDKNEIRFSMSAVKGVGESAAEEVIRARKLDGKFKSIEDFARRVSTSKFNRRAWESLIKAGGFDSFIDRSDALFNLDTIIEFASKVQKEALSGQTDLFSLLGEKNGGMRGTISMQQAPVKYTEKERLSWERELIGIFLSSHPLDDYDMFLNEQTLSLSKIDASIDNSKVTIGGLISDVRSVITKSGSKMAFVKIENKTGEIEAVVFPKLFSEIGAKLIRDHVVIIEGKVNARDRDGNLRDPASVIADSLREIQISDLDNYESTGKSLTAPKAKKHSSNSRNYSSKASAAITAREEKSVSVAVATADDRSKRIYVHIENPDDQESLMSLRSICSLHAGLSEIVLVLGTDDKSAILLPFRVDASDELIGKLVKMFDEDHVVIK